MALDQLQGKFKSASFVSKQLVSTPMVAEISQMVESKKLDIRFIHAQNILRPQLKFKDKIDNTNSSPFQHRLFVKLNALTPLPDGPLFRHPYQYELQRLTWTQDMLTPTPPTHFVPFSAQDYAWIDSEEQLSALAHALTLVKEYAIDLENHAYRSFQGFCCLMQISTRDKDFLIDALKLRHAMQQLNSSMTDARIVKVLHGSEHDIQWLQRDFGLYIVNSFDTFVASKMLSFPSHSLAYLLSHYVGVTADKKYQLADWRIRPLPEEMVKYAREDTHYLLYIYDRMKNDLATTASSSLLTVFQKSNEICGRAYEKPAYDPEDSWKSTFYKYAKPFTKQQMNIFKALHAWRDHIAREEDESVRFVLPNHMLFQIAEKMPTQISDILACCHPVPPLVRQHVTDLSILIDKAKQDDTDPLRRDDKTEPANHISVEDTRALKTLTTATNTATAAAVATSSSQGTSSRIFQLLSQKEQQSYHPSEVIELLRTSLPLSSSLEAINPTKGASGSLEDVRENKAIEEAVVKAPTNESTEEREEILSLLTPWQIQDVRYKTKPPTKKKIDPIVPFDYETMPEPQEEESGKKMKFDPFDELGRKASRSFTSSSFKRKQNGKSMSYKK